MLIDKRTASFDNQTVTADALGNSIDQLVKGYPANGNPLYFCVNVHDMDASSGNETYSVKLQHGSAVDGSGNITSAQDIPGTTITFDRDDGADFKFVTVPGTQETERYLAAAANPGGTTPSFVVDAWLTGVRPEFAPQYDDNYNWPSNA